VNGAVTDLGFPAGDGSTQKSGATGPFLDDAKLSAALTIIAPTITASASLGFIGVSASGAASLVADGSLSIVNPADGTSKVFVTDLAHALSQGNFLFTGNGSGPIKGEISAAAAAELNVTPDLGGVSVSGVDGLKATVAISLDVPDFLTAPPMLINDPLGFGHSTISFDGSTVSTLAQPLPANGRLTSDIGFVVVNGTQEQVETIKASDTSAFSSSSDLETLFQERLDAASGALGVGKITAGLGGGALTLEGPSGVKFRGNTFQVVLNGPDLDFFNQFSDGFSFDNVVKALQFVVNFLNSLTAGDSSGVGGVVHTVLDTKLPVINKSVSDLVNMAASFTNLLNQLQNNPASSIGKLESLLETVLGAPSSGSYVSYDKSASDGDALKFNFGVGTSFNSTIPFNLDLSQLGLPSFLSGLVGVSASGDLGVTLSANLALVLGIGITKNKDLGDVFLYTGAGGTRATAHAGASGDNLNFSANIGPFSIFVVNGSGSLSGDITLKLSDSGPDVHNGRLVLFSGGAFIKPNAGDFDTAPSDILNGTASVNLPLYIGSLNAPIPIGSPNALMVSLTG
jgi:hypothetical protein